jgi:predicted nucleic acid-binding protein
VIVPEAFNVYVETNWLVSCVLVHHELRRDARSLLEAAERGECSLRIPKVALLEARHVVERETEEHVKAVSMVASSLAAVARNLDRLELRELSVKVREAEASYRIANPRQELEELLVKCARFGFQHPEEEQLALDALRPVVAFRGTDISDLHILAAISADRAHDPTLPAAVISANSREFAVKSNSSKLPRDFYSSRRLVYLETFNLMGARKLWAREDAARWPAPRSTSADPRIQEAQRLVQAMPEERRDAALEALRNVQAGG